MLRPTTTRQARAPTRAPTREELQQALLMQHIQAIDDTLGRQGSQATVLQHQQSGLRHSRSRTRSRQHSDELVQSGSAGSAGSSGRSPPAHQFIMEPVLEGIKKHFNKRSWTRSDERHLKRSWHHCGARRQPDPFAAQATSSFGPIRHTSPPFGAAPQPPPTYSVGWAALHPPEDDAQLRATLTGQSSGGGSPPPPSPKAAEDLRPPALGSLPPQQAAAAAPVGSVGGAVTAPLATLQALHQDLAAKATAVAASLESRADEWLERLPLPSSTRGSPASADADAKGATSLGAQSLEPTSSPPSEVLMGVADEMTMDVALDFARNRRNRSALREATMSGEVATVRELLQASPQLVDEEDAFGETALMAAAEEHNKEMVEALLELGANVFHASKTEDTALSLLLESLDCEPDRAAQSDVALCLARAAVQRLPSQADVDELHAELRDVVGLLSDDAFAAFRHSQSMTAVMLWLAVFGIERTMETYHYTPFCLACEQGRLEVVEVLLDLGADTQKRNYLGHTGWDAAELAKQKAVERLLFKRAQERHDQLREEDTQRKMRPERWKMKVAERFVRTFLPIAGSDGQDGWSPLKARAGAFGVLWSINDLSPPIHVPGRTPVSSAVVKAVKYESGGSSGLVSHGSKEGVILRRAGHSQGSSSSAPTAEEAALQAEIETLSALAE